MSNDMPIIIARVVFSNFELFLNYEHIWDSVGRSDRKHHVINTIPKLGDSPTHEWNAVPDDVINSDHWDQELSLRFVGEEITTSTNLNTDVA